VDSKKWAEKGEKQGVRVGVVRQLPLVGGTNERVSRCRRKKMDCRSADECRGEGWGQGGKERKERRNKMRRRKARGERQVRKRAAHKKCPVGHPCHRLDESHLKKKED